MTGFTPKVRRICTVEGCDKPLRARGYCATHWARWRRHGAPVLLPTYELCTVDGCDREPRSSRNLYCETHYYRLRRTGTTEDPKRICGPCRAEGCSEPASHGGRRLGLTDRGYCRMHYLRLINRGDVNRDGRWEDHYRWTGESATYQVMHQRVKKVRGAPSKHRCVDCDKRAQHWSYDHSDPEQRFQPGKGPYSTDIYRYHPRCAKCHKRFDIAAKAGRQ